MNGQPEDPRQGKETVAGRAAGVQPGRLAGLQHPAAVVIVASSPRSNWLLPDDGIVDEVAVEIAASGKRIVRLTCTERRAAAVRILAAGGNAYTIAKRLRRQYASARVLAASIAETVATEGSALP